MEKETFYKVFPKSKAPLDHLKLMIKVETEGVSNRVMDLVKLWDQKLVTLRREMNLNAIHKKMRTFADLEAVTTDFDAQSKRINKVEKEIGGLDRVLEAVNLLSETLQVKIQQMEESSKEVLIGKRNVNCLSCAGEPKDTTGVGSDGRLYRGLSNERDELSKSPD